MASNPHLAIWPGDHSNAILICGLHRMSCSAPANTSGSAPSTSTLRKYQPVEVRQQAVKRYRLGDEGIGGSVIIARSVAAHPSVTEVGWVPVESQFTDFIGCRSIYRAGRVGDSVDLNILA
jgi:hypothetical protein